MFNTSIVTTGLLGLVGFRQPFNPDLPTLDAANLTSRSGLIINDAAFAKLDYLIDSQDFSDITDVQFNTFLQNKQKESIINVCNAVFNESVYIDKQVLYKNAFNKVETETLPDGFICFEIEVSSKKNVAFEIKRVLLDFEGSGDIELLLFNTAQESSPLFSKVINITSTHQAEELNWVIDNSGDTYKGEYYFGYLSNFAGIGTLKPFKKNFNKGDVQSIITYMDFERGLFPGMSSNVLPDLNDFTGNSNSTGLNPDVSVYFDYTELIINNQRLFATAINYDMQINILSEVANSIRSNRKQRLGKENFTIIMANIEGQSSDVGISITGLRPQLKGFISTIKKEIKSLKEGYFGERAYIETMI